MTSICFLIFFFFRLIANKMLSHRQSFPPQDSLHTLIHTNTKQHTRTHTMPAMTLDLSLCLDPITMMYSKLIISMVTWTSCTEQRHGGVWVCMGSVKEEGGGKWIHKHTNTHAHTHARMHVCVCVCVRVHKQHSQQYMRQPQLIDSMASKWHDSSACTKSGLENTRSWAVWVCGCTTCEQHN